MEQVLTPGGTEIVMQSLEQKYPTTGKKGNEGEIWLLEILKKRYEVFDYRQNKTIQSYFRADFGIKKYWWTRKYLLDIKNNLRVLDTEYIIPIEVGCYEHSGWFLKSFADRIYHTNVEKEIFLYYDLEKLRFSLFKNLLYNDTEGIEKSFYLDKYLILFLYYSKLPQNLKKEIKIVDKNGLVY